MISGICEGKNESLMMQCLNALIPGGVKKVGRFFRQAMDSSGIE